jgi:hypothetical protein
MLITTGNCNSFMNLHTLQITAPNIKSSLSLPGIARLQFQTLEILLLSCLHRCWLATITQLTNLVGWSVKLLLDVTSTVICSYSLPEIHDKDIFLS